MKAKRYRVVRPSILSAVTVGMVAQSCYVPTLLAMDSSDRARQRAVYQHELETRYQSQGITYPRAKADLVSSVSKRIRDDRSNKLDREEVLFFRDDMRGMFDRFQAETARLRQELLETDASDILVKRLDAYVERETLQYMQFANESMILANALGETGERRDVGLKRFRQYLQSRDVPTYLPSAKRAVELPRQLSKPTNEQVSQVPFFSYPWSVASSGDYVGEIFSDIDDSDLLADPLEMVQPEDLQPSPPEIVFDNEGDFDQIAELAVADLESDPVRIFEYVRNNIVFEPYFGAMKGAARTLDEGRGNDMDQACLLVSMLRAVDIPARLTFGTIEIDLDDAADWLGVDDPSSMLDVMRTGGVPAEFRFDYNVPVALRVDHVWVTAQVRLEPFRGAREGQQNGTGNTWIDLDPSFKQHTFEQHDIAQVLSMQPNSLFINSQVGASVEQVSQDSFIGSADFLRDNILLEELVSLAAPVRNYLSDEGLEPESVYFRREISGQRFGLFPISDEYQVVNTGVSARGVPENLTHRLQMVIYDSMGNPLDPSVYSLGPNGQSARMASLAGDRLILGYQADAVSQAYIEGPSFDPDTAAIMIRVYPELYVGERPVQTTQDPPPMVPGSLHVVEFEFFEPSSELPRIYRQVITVGSMHAFTLGAQGFSESDLEQTKDELDAISNGGLSSLTDFQAVVRSVGATLDSVGRSYFHQINRYNEVAAGVTGVYATRLPSLARVSWEVVTSNPNEPADLDIGPVTFDIVRDIYSAVPRSSAGLGQDGFGASENRFRLMASYLSNTLELGAIELQLFAQKGIAANKAIKLANQDDPDVSASRTIAPGADVATHFAAGGEFATLPQPLKDLITSFADEHTEFMITDQPVQALSGGDSFYAVYIHDHQDGDGAVLQYNATTNTFSSASVAAQQILDYDGDDFGQDSGSQIPRFEHLIHYIPTGENHYVDVAAAASSSLLSSSDTATNTALWYLPALANVDSWLVGREEVESVVLPLTALMLAQPVDQFATQPSILGYNLAIGDDTNSVWAANPEHGARENANHLHFTATATRSTHYEINVIGSDSQVVDDLTIDGNFSTSNPVPVNVIDRTAVVSTSTPPADGFYTYEMHTSRNSDSAVSLPVSGSFGIDMTAPQVALANSTPVGQEGEFRLQAQMFDALRFGHGTIDLVRESTGETIESRDITLPIYDLTDVWVIDTTSGEVNEAWLDENSSNDSYRFEASVTDTAGNKAEAVLGGFQVNNPPDPAQVNIDVVANVTYDYAGSGTTQLDGQTIAFDYTEGDLQVDVAINSATLTWPGANNTNPVLAWIERIEVLINGDVYHQVDYSNQPTSLTNESFAVDVPFGRFVNGEQLDLVVRVIPSLGQAEEIGPIQFTLTGSPITAFSVTPTSSNWAGPIVRVGAIFEAVSAPSSHYDYWVIALFKDINGDQQFTENEFVEVPSGAISGPRVYDFSSTNSSIFYHAPTNEQGQYSQGDIDEIEIFFNFSVANIPDSNPSQPYHIVMMAATHWFNSSYFNGVSVSQQIDVDLQNSAIARIDNLVNPSEASSVEDFEQLLPLPVESGFFDLFGEAYDADPNQSGVEYRIELRPASDAVQIPSFYPGTGQEVYFAVPPEEASQELWTAQGLANPEDAWFEIPDGEDRGPLGAPHRLATIDMTGLQDGVYEVALVVRSGPSLSVDLGTVALNSPTKVGRFTFSQEDVSLPSVDYPLTLVRTYDSLRKSVDGPFGLGWDMSIFDLDFELHEVRNSVTEIYGSQLYDATLSGSLDPDLANLQIRNSSIMDRSVSLTLPDGRRVTFPFVLESGPMTLYPTYRTPAGFDGIKLTAGSRGIDRELEIDITPWGPQWPSSSRDSIESHFDIREWVLTLEDGTQYSIKRQMLSDRFTFHVGVPGASGSRFVDLHPVWGEPYVSKISFFDRISDAVPSEVIDIQYNPSTGQISGFEVTRVDSEGGPESSQDDLFRFVYSNTVPPRIIALFGPTEDGTLDDSLDDWNQPLYIYEYSAAGQLTTVARVNEVNTGTTSPDSEFQWDLTHCADCDETTFVYDTTEPGLIRQIIDPRGLSPATTEYDDAGRLKATVDQYGGRIEIARDVEARTETIIDRRGSSVLTTVYQYDERGNVLFEEQANGKVITRTYDDEDRLETEQESGRDRATEYDYATEGSREITTVTDPIGNVTETVQDIRNTGIPRSIVTTQTIQGQDPIRTEQLFDTNGNLTDTISGATHVKNEYDGKKRLVRTLLPEIDPETGNATGQFVTRTEYTYDEANPALLLSTKQFGANGESIEQHFRYDHLGRQWASYTVSPDENGLDHSVIDYQVYDNAGRVVATRRDVVAGSEPQLDSANGVLLSTSYYNSIDQVIVSVDKVRNTTTSTLYDLRGNVIETATWPIDLSDHLDFDDYLDWLENPAASGVSVPSQVWTNPTYPVSQDGPIVTRTVYNDRGQQLYSTEPYQISAMDYSLDSHPSEFNQIIRHTLYDEFGRATMQERGEGVIELDIQQANSFGMELDGQFENPVLLSESEYDIHGRVDFTLSYNDLSDMMTGVVTTRYEYDENDRQRFVRVEGMAQNGDDLLTEYVYDEAGRQTAVIDPRGNRVEYEYDSQGRRTHTRYQDPQHAGMTEVETMYDSRGRRIAEIDQEGRVRSFRYDADDRLSSVTLLDPDATDDSDQARYEYEYDLRGNITSITDPNGQGTGHETSFKYNELGQRVSRTLPGNRTESWTYVETATNGYGQVETHTDFVGNVTEFIYDDLGRVSTKRISDPSAVVQREYVYTYDELGRVSERERKSRVTGSLVPDRHTGWIYDDHGRLEKLYQPEGIITYSYYATTGRIKAINTYDGDFGAHPNNPSPSDLVNTTAYTYDNLDRLKSVTQEVEGVDRVWTYHYNETGARRALEYDSGSTESYVTLYEYDTLGRLTQLENRYGGLGSEGDIVSAYAYTHDKDGRRASVNEIREESTGSYSHVRVDFEYDVLGRLVGEDSQGLPDGTGFDALVAFSPSLWVNHPDLDERAFTRSYEYDLAGNRLSRYTDYASGSSLTQEYVRYDYMSDGSDRLEGFVAYENNTDSGTVLWAEDYTYDANGFMRTKSIDTDGVSGYEFVQTLTPNVEDRLVMMVQVDDVAGASAGDISRLYDYNEQGVRVLAGSTRYLIDTQNYTGYAQVLVERPSGTLSDETRFYAIGDDVLGQAIDLNTAFPKVHHLFLDGHGSVRQLMKADGTGVESLNTRAERYDYDAYGEAFGWELDDPGTSITRPESALMYAGEQWDADLGMQYLRARYYLPGQGVFTRLDPYFGNQTDPQSLNKYAYTDGDPVNGIDPLGLFTLSEVMTSLAGNLNLALRSFRAVTKVLNAVRRFTDAYEALQTVVRVIRAINMIMQQVNGGVGLGKAMLNGLQSAFSGISASMLTDFRHSINGAHEFLKRRWRDFYNKVSTNIDTMATEATQGAVTQFPKFMEGALDNKQVIVVLDLPSAPSTNPRARNTILFPKIIDVGRLALIVKSDGRPGRFLGLGFVSDRIREPLDREEVDSNTNELIRIDYQAFHDTSATRPSGRYEPHYHVQPNMSYHHILRNNY